LNQRLSPLIELQKLDLRIMEISEQRRKIPDQLHQLETPLREARQVLQETVVSMESAVKERRGYERDVEAQDAHNDKMRARLSEIKTNKEYQAHLFELQMANKKKSEIEDKVLACMEKIEQLQRTMKEAQERVEAVERTFAEEKHVLDELEGRLSGELPCRTRASRSLYQVEIRQKGSGSRRHQGRHVYGVSPPNSSPVGGGSQAFARPPYLPLLSSDALLGGRADDGQQTCD